MRWKSSLTLCALAIWSGLAIGEGDMHAAVVTLIAGDPLNYTSFNTGLNWSNGLPPSSGNTYVVTGLDLRTPQSHLDFTFAGDSLTINGGGSLLFKGYNGYTITINNLTIDNGIVANGAGGGPTFNLAGNTITLGNGGLTLDPAASNRGIDVVTSMTGNGGITTFNTGTAILSSANTYTGATTISSATLQLNNANAVQDSTVTINLDNGLTFTSGIGSFNLGGLAGNNLVNLADTGSNPVTLNVGGNGQTTTFGGTLTGVGGLTKFGTGMLTLSGINTYSGTTTVNAGTLVADAVNTLSGNSALITSGGTLDVSGFGQTIKSLTIGSLGSLNLTIGNCLTSTGLASLNGTLNLFGTTSGTQDLMNYLSRSGSFSNVIGVPLGYTLDYSSTQLDLIACNNSILKASAISVSLGRVMFNHVPTANLSIGLASGTSATGFSTSVTGGVTASASGSGAGAITPSGSGTVTVGLTNVTGSYSGTVQVQNSGDNGNGGGPSSAGPGQGNAQSPISISVTGTVVNNCIVTASTTNFGLVHVGAAVSQPIMLSTTGDDSNFTRVSVSNVGPDANGISVSGGTNPVFNGSSVTDQRTLGGIISTVGTINGLITLPTTGEGLSGEAPINVPVNYVAQVYSGQAEWNAKTGVWGTSANWEDTVGGGLCGVPGILGYSTDTATFGPTASRGVVVVSLESAAPVLNNLIFSNANVSYWILQGTGTTELTLTGTDSNSPAAVTVVSGKHWVEAPILLDSNLVVSASGSLGISGNITESSGSRSLTLDGGGELILSGTNSYSGGTVVNSGELTVINNYSLPSGGSLTVGAGGVLVFDPSAPAVPLTSSQGAQVINPVPEPQTLMLLGVGAICLLGFGWRRRRLLRI